MKTEKKDANAEARDALGMNGTQKNATITDLILAQKKGFEMALPKDWDPDRFVRIAITAIKNSAGLQKCDPMSVLGALMLSAQTGLEPNSPLHEASLIPYKGRAQFQIEYRGLLKLVYNSGMVEFVDYDKVCENETFEFTKGFNPIFIHHPAHKGLRLNAYGYYAVAVLKGGSKVVHYMTKDEVFAHGKKFSKSFENSPWQTDFDAMAYKTVLKQLADKKLPKKTTAESLLFHQAIDKDEKVSTLSEDQLNKKVTLDDIETEPANFEDIEKTDEETVENWEYAPFVIERIAELETVQAVNKFRKDQKKHIDAFGGSDGDLIKIAFDEIEEKIITSKAKEKVKEAKEDKKQQ
jgi:recombination protein RecT